MADIVRAIYILNDEHEMRFSAWVHEDDKQIIRDYLAAVNPSVDGGTPGVVPTIIGWEEKVFAEEV
jgi:hypothetical protein